MSQVHDYGKIGANLDKRTNHHSNICIYPPLCIIPSICTTIHGLSTLVMHTGKIPGTKYWGEAHVRSII